MKHATEKETAAENCTVFPDIQRIEDAINDMLPGLTLYVRDVNLNPACAAAYQPDTILLERGFTDASNLVKGLITTHRIAILSNHMADLRGDDNGGVWGLFVANHHARFKVLDVYEYNERSQILLLHYPDDNTWKMFRDMTLSIEEELISTCRDRFRSAYSSEPAPALATDEWLERCEKPVGMDDDGHLYDPEEEPGKLSKEILDLEYCIIMNIIRNGLTEDPEKDAAWLQRKMEQYRTHVLSAKIIMACARILYSLLPDDGRSQIKLLIGSIMEDADAWIGQARQLIAEGKTSTAKKMIDTLAEEADRDVLNCGNQSDQSFCFREWFEMCLYRNINKPAKELREARYAYDEIYYLQGALSVETKDLTGARKALRKALRWNPVSTSSLFKYAETFKMEGDMERYFREIRKIQKVCFRTEDVARFLRGAGYYYGETGQYDAAMLCIVRSLIYDQNSETAAKELEWLTTKHNVPIPELNKDRCRAFEKEYGVVPGTDNRILEMLYTYGKNFMDSNEPDGARYCLGLLYDLTDDEDIYKMIRNIPTIQ